MKSDELLCETVQLRSKSHTEGVAAERKQAAGDDVTSGFENKARAEWASARFLKGPVVRTPSGPPPGAEPDNVERAGGGVCRGGGGGGRSGWSLHKTKPCVCHSGFCLSAPWPASKRRVTLAVFLVAALCLEALQVGDGKSESHAKGAMTRICF